MTVSTTVNKISYPGNGATLVFSFSFPAIVGTNLQVFFTDSSGTVTLQSPATYTVTLNPATGTNPTQAGGFVTFTVAPPTGTTVTIYRNLSLVQATSLANQGTLYQPVEEAALDYVMMVSQQVLEVQNRALVVPVSDPTPSPIPAVAQRANLAAGYDSNGDPIAFSTAPAGTISSAMAPVVSAASLAAGRTAFGLGSSAVSNAGGSGTGITVSGGSLFVLPTVTVDATPQTVTGAFHFTYRFANAAITYTLPLSTTLASGFTFTVAAGAGAVTFAVNVADAFTGMGVGVSLVIPQGTQAAIYTNAAGLWFITYNQPLGFNAPANLQINTSVAASALTIALKERNGNDPSASSPVLFTVSGSGTSVSRAVAAPLSITVPNGATLGTINGQACRIWIGLFDNAGTPVLGVFNALNPSTLSIVYWDESTAISTTNISAGSTLAQTWYTNGAVTTKSFRIIGYLEATEPTAGAWTVAPVRTQLFGAGQRKPGDVVQELYTTTTTGGTTTSATFVALTTGQTIVITPTNAANIIRVESQGTLSITTGAHISITISRGTTANTNLIGNIANANTTAAFSLPGAVLAYDLPNTTGSTTYAIQGKTDAGTLTYGGASLQTVMSVKE